MRPRRFDLIAFDWDGTLFDSTALIVRCIQAACVDVDAPAPTREQAAWVIGMGLREALAHAAPGVVGAQLDRLVERYRHHYFANQHEVTLFEGTLPMLRALHARHHWLAVATGKSRRGLDAALASTELHSLFDASRTADETAGKPNPQMLLELMGAFGTPPERCLMVGDTTHDLQMAVNAGCPAVAVAFGAHEPEAFGEFAPLFIAHTTPELHQWLEAHA
ncbi:MAG: HAD-IA family hydrolase [Proteobacteria bacterium]|nr:HAD-IA family hydrolase [Pseudomonadota bacterium]